MNSSEFQISKFANPGGTDAFRVTGWLNGKRIRQNYKTEAEAVTEKHRLEREVLNLVPLPAVTTRLTSEQVAEAEAGYHRLAGHKLSLTAAVNFALEHWTDTDRQSTVAAAIAEFLKEKKQANARPATLRSLAVRLGGEYERKGKPLKTRIETLGKKWGESLVNTITADNLKPLIFRDGSSLVNQDSDYRALTNFFNWCLKKHYCRKSPMGTIPRIELERIEPEVLTLAQVRHLVNTAQTFKEGKLVPYITLALFCAIRPTEIARLTWDNVNTKRFHVTIGAQIAKMRGRRLVDISANAIEFLRLHAISRTPFVGQNWRKDFDTLKALAGLDDWTPDVLRHTGISYHLAEWQHEGKTAAWAGNSPDVIQRHYKGLVDQDDSKEFWTIKPGIAEPEQMPKSKAA